MTRSISTAAIIGFFMATMATMALADAPATRPAVTMGGKAITLAGDPPTVGDTAPAFTAVGVDMKPFTFTPGDGTVWIIASVPSVDTSVCSTETRRFNQEAAGLAGVRVLTISMDLPFAQRRWCAAEGIEHLTTVSDYKDREFSAKWGLRIQENGLLARAVYVIDGAGKIVHRQIVAELSHEPDYAAAIAAAKR